MASDLVLTVRVFDPDEKKDATLSACWAKAKIDRANVGGTAESLAQQLVPLLKQIKNLRLT